MAAKNALFPAGLNSFNTASLTGSYQVVSSGGFDVDLAIYKVFNSSSESVTISYDGSTDQDIIPSGGTFILDIQANKEGDRAAWPKGREMFVKGTASAGAIYEIGYTIKKG